MFCSLLPFPLGHQNIPDGCNIPYYPLNIQFPTPNAPNSERTHLPATSGIVVIYLLVPPTPCSTPPPYYTPLPSHPAPSAYQPPYPLIQKTLFVILTSPAPRHTPWFTLFFGWWGLSHIHWSCIVGQTLVWRLGGSSYRWGGTVVKSLS